MKVYVAAPYADAERVRDVHDYLRHQGHSPTSRWAEAATDAEDFSKFRPEELSDFAAQNDGDVRAADAVLVLARSGAGGEMFAEARIAIEWGKRVLWVGRRTLSAWRPGVERFDSVPDAIQALEVGHAA